jgi:glycosyltransferase involved in cell wall biosynthesis
LPPPPSNKGGWPWTADLQPLPETIANGAPWPRISIVTPSLNQGKYIEETIRSVLLQGYPALEYFIMDGGSTDGTVEVIKRYDAWLTHWVSEPDKGQSHAINKGFDRATGQICAYINSDDLYCPDAFATVAPLFTEDGKPHLVAGACVIFKEEVEKSMFRPSWPRAMGALLRPFSTPFAQPASFWSQEIHERVGGFDTTLHYCFDQEFFLKIGLEGITPHLLSKTMARHRHHLNIKTNQTIRFYEESIPVIKRHARACGLSEKEAEKLLRQSENEVRYIEVFVTWKNKGRLQAMTRFMAMVASSPDLVFKRKILGLGRRLLAYNAREVTELRNV